MLPQGGGVHGEHKRHRVPHTAHDPHLRTYPSHALFAPQHIRQMDRARIQIAPQALVSSCVMTCGSWVAPEM